MTLETDIELHPAVWLARSNMMGCAYNAAVNSGSERAAKKMRSLIEAINHYERVRGRVQLLRLVELGVIDTFTPCPPECVVRSGGLFHAAGCENDMNHPTTRWRQQRARELLPGGSDGHAGWRAASATLVGEES